MSMQMLPTYVTTQDPRRRLAMETAMVLVLSLALATAANATEIPTST